MKVWILWHGGPSYVVGTVDEDVETFDSLRDAKRAFSYRAERRDPYYPCVEDSSALVWRTDPRGKRDPYPDLELVMGPRGGVQVRPC